MQLYISLSSTFFFILLHFTSSYVFTRIIKPKQMYKLSSDDRINLNEKICSTVNGVIISGIGIYLCFFTNVFEEDLHAFPSILEFAFPFYLGYSVYDLLTMYFQVHHWTMWLHHFLGILGSLMMILFKKAAYYPCFFMITELTAVTDNLFWYYKMLVLPTVKSGRRKTRLQKEILPLIRASSFVFFRVWIGPYSIYKSASLSGGWVNMFLDWARMPLYISLVGPMLILTLTLLNIVWTAVIVQKYFKKSIKD